MPGAENTLTRTQLGRSSCAVEALILSSSSEPFTALCSSTRCYELHFVGPLSSYLVLSAAPFLLLLNQV